jgi:[ribosomal protein S5]-alanine N-acetyltransferase
VLVSERLLLRPFEASDVAAVHRYASDPVVSQFMDWGPNDEATSAAFVEFASAPRDADADDFQFAVTLLETAELIGGCSLAIESRLHRRASLGYVLASECWGQGLGTEVALTLKAFAYETLGIHRLEATCHPDNIASARVLTKAGLALEGRMRDHMFVRDTWRDSLLLGAVNDDAR